MNELLKFAIVVFFLLTIPTVLIMILDRGQCLARWEKSETTADWGIMTGCIIKQGDGTWIPERVLRSIDE